MHYLLSVPIDCKSIIKINKSTRFAIDMLSILFERIPSRSTVWTDETDAHISWLPGTAPSWWRTGRWCSAPTPGTRPGCRWQPPAEQLSSWADVRIVQLLERQKIILLVLAWLTTLKPVWKEIFTTIRSLNFLSFLEIATCSERAFGRVPDKLWTGTTYSK